MNVPARIQPAEEQAARDALRLVSARKPARKEYRVALLAGTLLLAALVVAHGIRKGEFDYNVDEAQHAVTGLFVADALHDLPLSSPVQYAYHYYGQYPAVAIVHWPPLFYLFEGLSFKIFGPTVMAARLTVLLFALLLGYQWFKLVDELTGPLTAAVSTAMLALLPTVLLFEKTVMLEIPSLALAVAAIRSWIQFLESGQRRFIYGFALWISAALLCKQTNVYVLLFCALSVAATRQWERLRSRDFFMAAGLSVLLVAPFYVLMLVVQGRAVANDLGSHQLWGWERLTYYWTALPRTFTLPMLGLSVVGFIASPRWDRSRNTLLMLSWVLAGYVTFTIFGQSEDRFCIYWFPPLVYFAAGLLVKGFRLPGLRLAMRSIAIVVVAFMAIRAWGYERPYIAGYETLAARLIGTYRSGVVLYDGRVPGNFVFYMRALDPRRQFLILRKSLYVTDVRADKNSQELLHSPEDVRNLFKSAGIRFVVVADNAPPGFQSQVLLRDYLRNDQFRLLGTFPIQSNEAAWQGKSLQLYENKGWAPPEDKFLRIRMLTLNHDIVLPLDHFEFAQKSPALNGQGDK
jgi:dolichyl-phosphate-mannose-protein mannosyltransferase